MSVRFSGNGSFVEAATFTWDMTYPITGTKRYVEKGFHIHIAPQDASAVADVVKAGYGVVAAAAAAGAVAGPAGSASAGAVAAAWVGLEAAITFLIGRLISNKDGSIDFRISPHGFQADDAEAGDPNIWFALFPPWHALYAALAQLNGQQAAPVRAENSQPAHSAGQPKGKLVGTARF
jgi:hypothetical protein